MIGILLTQMTKTDNIRLFFDKFDRQMLIQKPLNRHLLGQIEISLVIKYLFKSF